MDPSPCNPGPSSIANMRTTTATVKAPRVLGLGLRVWGVRVYGVWGV